MNISESIRNSNADPHAAQPVASAGLPPEEADATIILIHGRGASAQSILALYKELGQERLAAIAPQASDHTWYPYSFLAPLEDNQPFLDSALSRIESLVRELLDRGIARERIVLIGFSQGACLAAEFAARHPRHYGAVISLTGGLIGPPGTSRDYVGSLAGTRVFLGSGDPDPHVPFERVRETSEVLKRMGAKVELRRYTGLPHTINEDELEVCRDILKHVAAHKDDSRKKT